MSLRAKIKEYQALRKHLLKEIHKTSKCLNGATEAILKTRFQEDLNALWDELDKTDEKILWAKRTQEVLRMKQNCDKDGNLVYRPFQKLRSMKL